MHDAGQASRDVTEAVAVNPILQTISSNISTMSAGAAVPPQQSGTGQGGPGSFASTVAAAQGLPTASLAGASGVSNSDQLVAGSAETPTTLNMPASPSGSPQPKKLPGSNLPLSLPPVAAMNTVVALNAAIVPQVNPTVNVQVPSLPQQPNLLQSSVAQSGLWQSNVPAPLARAAEAQSPDGVAGTVQSGLSATALGATVQRTAPSYSATNQTATDQTVTDQTVTEQTGLNQTAVNQTASEQSLFNIVVPSQFVPNQTKPTQIVPNQTEPTQTVPNHFVLNPTRLSSPALNQTSPSQILPSNTAANQTAAKQAVLNPVLQRIDQSNGWLPSSETTAAGVNDSPTQNILITNVNRSAPAKAAPTMLAENTQPSSLSTTETQIVSSTALLSIFAGGQGNEPIRNDAALGTATAGWLLHSDQRADAAPAAETLLANASPETGSATSSLLSSRIAFPVTEAGSGDANTPDPDPAAQSGPSVQTAAASSLPEILNGQILSGQITAPSVLNLPSQAMVGKTSPQFSAPRITAAVASPMSRGASVGAPVNPPSTVASALPAGSESGTGVPVASQTPFSVFFSGPGPGTESAASALPKMMLPPAGVSLKTSHTLADATSATPPTGGLQSGIRQNAAPQTTVPQTTKDSPSGTESGTLQNPPTIRTDGNLNTASIQSVSPQTATAPGISVSTSGGVTAPVGGQATLNADPLPKTQPPALFPGSPASVLPAPPEPAVLGAVQVAQMVNRLGQSEMRIGLNTTAFGSVEVRTIVRTSDVGLVIGSEKGDLRTLMANELPAITNALQQQNLRLNSVNFMQGFAFSNSSSGGGDSQQRSFIPTHAASADPASPEATPDDPADTRPSERWGGGSISILA